MEDKFSTAKFLIEEANSSICFIVQTHASFFSIPSVLPRGARGGEGGADLALADVLVSTAYAGGDAEMRVQ